MNQVLLIIDTQKDLVEGSLVEQGVFQKDLLLSKINLLIQKARKLAVPVIFIRDKDVAGGEGEGFDVHPEIDRVSGDACFDKEATNAFYRTGLLDYLKHHQVEHLVIAGCKTEHCIDTAVRTATVNGFDVTLAGDAHSTSNSDVLSANQIIAHHNAVLHGHYNVDHFSIVRKVEEDLFTPSHDTYR